MNTRIYYATILYFAVFILATALSLDQCSGIISQITILYMRHSEEASFPIFSFDECREDK